MHRNEILSTLKKKLGVSVLIGSPDFAVKRTRFGGESLLIIGGGINGIGTLRDLTLNRVEVLLVERGDFCSGAGSASSHMAHGGTDFIPWSLSDDMLREISFHAQHEKICHLDDFLLRRSMLARALGNALGWDEEWKTAEVGVRR